MNTVDDRQSASRNSAFLVKFGDRHFLRRKETAAGRAKEGAKEGTDAPTSRKRETSIVSKTKNAAGNNAASAKFRN